jgi:Amt family ammonium transporter
MATPFPSDVPATGGNSLETNLNQYYAGADLAWIMASSALVLIMIPGVAFFYSGLARRKSALSLIHLGLITLAVVTFEWFLWGYSLTFSKSASPFIGDLSMLGFKDVLAAPSSGAAGLPDILYSVYQLMFAAITPAIAVGAAAERGRLLPCMVFVFVWSTIVYK